jgi:hypothetical protein
MSHLRKSIWDGLRRITPPRLRPTGYVTHLAHVRTGGCVHSGPFVGMKYIQDSWFGGYIPKLLGVYERELHGALEAAIARKPDLIVDVGAAEGYYAVGLCRRVPGAKHIAFEMGKEARVMMAELARLNGCQIDIRGECDPEKLEAALAGSENPLAVIDVESYEKVLVDPEKVPSLRRAMMLVELHPGRAPGIFELLNERFGQTHQIQRIWGEDRDPSEYPFDSLVMRMLPARHRAWALDEGRGVKMSWLWMVRRGSQA